MFETLTLARFVRAVAATALAAGLLTAGALGASAAPAAADQPLCNLLPVLCPPTTVAPPPAPATTATTKAPAPATARPVATTATTKAGAKAAVVNKPAPTAAGTAGLIGAGALDPAALGQPIPAAAAPSAPELAPANPADGQTATTTAPSDFSSPAALALTSGGGPPTPHTGLRILLSLVTLGIAGLAAAQLPASRRRRDTPVDGVDLIDGL